MLSLTLYARAVTEPDIKRQNYWILRSTIMRLLLHFCACLLHTQCVSRLSQPGLVVVASKFTALMHSSLFARTCCRSKLVDSWYSSRHRHPRLDRNLRLREVLLWHKLGPDVETQANRSGQFHFHFTTTLYLFSSPCKSPAG